MIYWHQCTLPLRLGAKLSDPAENFQSKFNIKFHFTSTTSKGPSENFLKNVMGLSMILVFVQFWGGSPGVLGDSVIAKKRSLVLSIYLSIVSLVNDNDHARKPNLV